MATKTFTNEFKLNTKNASNLLDALSTSERVDIKPTQEIKAVHDKIEIKKIMAEVLK